MELKKTINLSDSAMMCPCCFRSFPIRNCTVDINFDINEKAEPLRPKINHRYILHEGERAPTDVHVKKKKVPAIITIPCPQCDVAMVRVDKPIIEYIVLMNLLGMHTYYSCSGHINRAPQSMSTPVNPEFQRLYEASSPYYTAPYVVFSTDRRIIFKKNYDAKYNKNCKLPIDSIIQYNFRPFLRHDSTIHASLTLGKPYQFLHDNASGVTEKMYQNLTQALSFRLFNQLIKEFIENMSRAEKIEKSNLIDVAIHRLVIEKDIYLEHEKDIIDILDALASVSH